MADYNVNMKQWNGTSFDNVLPLAYNAKQLEGQSLAEVKQWVQDNGLLLYTGQYTGTGTYSYSHPTSITFPFEPIILLTPFNLTMAESREQTVLPTQILRTSYMNMLFAGQNSASVKKSIDGKTISWYNTSGAYQQCNESGTIYYYAAIGGYDMGGN